MAKLRLPLAGDVTQFISSWFGLFSQRDGQIGLFNVNVELGKTDAPKLEEDILNEVGTYGHQLGRIGDALAVLVSHVDASKLSPAEDKALKDLKTMLDGLAEIRTRHGRGPAVTVDYPPPAPVPGPAAAAAPALPEPPAAKPRPAPARRRKPAADTPSPEG